MPERNGTTTILPRERRTQAPRSMTAFGRALSELRTTYSFHNQDLVGEHGLSHSQAEQLSRISTRLEAVRSMSPERCERLVADTVAAIVQRLRQTWDDVTLPPELYDNLYERLLAAAKRDREAAKRSNLALRVGELLEQMTGRSLAQLAVDLENHRDRDNPSELFDSWRAHRVAVQTSRPAGKETA
jgi:hypothetical protein